MSLSQRWMFLGAVMMMAVSGNTRADDVLNDKGDKGDKAAGVPQATRALTWQDFREACRHPAQFGSQRAPQNVKVLCTNQQTTWVAAPSGEVNLQGARRLTIAVTSDKYHVAPFAAEVPVYSKVGSCSRFREVVETYTAPERVVSCDEILGYKGELADLCAEEVDKSKGNDSKLIQTLETGRMIDTCGGNASGGAAPKPAGRKL